MALALFLILFFPSYAVQWFGYLSLAAVFGSYVYSRSMARHLEITRTRSQTMTYRGRTTHVELRITNRGFLRIPYLAVLDTTGGLYTADKERRIITLAPGQTYRLHYPVKGVNRGVYRLGPVRVRMSDPLGLYPKALEIREIATVVIYPQVYPVELTDTRGLPAGTVRVSNPVYDDATRYRSIREYVPGDDPRKIEWKVSARLGRLHSLQHLPTVCFPTLVVLNLTAADYQTRHRFHHTERAIEAAASLVFYAVGKGQDVGLLTSGVIRGTGDTPALPIRGGSDHGSLLLATLARLSANETDIDAVAMLFEKTTVPYGTRVQYVGPRLRRDQVDYLASRVRAGANMEFFYIQERARPEDSVRLRLFPEYVVREYGQAIVTRDV